MEKLDSSSHLKRIPLCRVTISCSNPLSKNIQGELPKMAQLFNDVEPIPIISLKMLLFKRSIYLHLMSLHFTRHKSSIRFEDDCITLNQIRLEPDFISVSVHVCMQYILLYVTQSHKLRQLKTLYK